MSLPAYWINQFLFDLIKTEITMAASIGMFYAFNVGYEDVWILFLLYPFGTLAFTYACSFIFKNEGTA